MPSSELSGVFCYVYVLFSSAAGHIYVGFSNDLKRRLAEHNIGLNFATKPYGPWELIYYEAHTSENDAKRREKYLKTTAGSRALNRILREKLSVMQNLNHQKVYC